MAREQIEARLRCSGTLPFKCREVVVCCPVACEGGSEELDGAFNVGDFKYARHHAESAVEHGGKQRYAAVGKTCRTHALFPEHGTGCPEAEFGRKEGVVCPEPLHIAVACSWCFVEQAALAEQ